MKKKQLILIFILAIISILPLIINNMIYGHDSYFHLANINDFYSDFSSFNLNTISSNIGYNLGYGIRLFYPNLPHIIGGFIKLITTPLNISSFANLTIIYLLLSFISTILIYKISLMIFKKDSLALLSSTIFLFMPYRIGSIIVRSAYSEVFIYPFILLIILSLLYYLQKNYRKFTYLFVIGYLGLVNSHLVMALYFTIFLLIFSLFYIKEIFNKEGINHLLKTILVVTALSLVSIIPTVQHLRTNNYYVNNEGLENNLYYVENYNMTISKYIIPEDDYSWEIPLYINTVVIVLTLISVIYTFLVKVKKEHFSIIIIALLIFIMTLNNFPWKLLPSFMYNIQFTWRLLTFLLIIISIFSPFVLISFKKEKYLSYVLTGLIIISSFGLLSKLSTYKYLLDTEIDYNNGLGHSSEYLSKKAHNAQDYIKSYYDNNDLEIISDTPHKLVFKTNQNGDIEVPRLYYLGYKLYQDNKEVPIKESEHGLITATVTNNSNIILTYEKTILHKLSEIIFIITISGLVIMNIKKRLF